MQHEGEHGGAAGDPGAKLAGLPSGDAAPERRRAPLTGREREILGLLADGLSGAGIAEQLVLSPETVRTHVRNAMAKLGASTRSQAVAIALRSHEIADQPVARRAADPIPEAVAGPAEDVTPALARMVAGLVALYDLEAGAVYLADADGLGLHLAAAPAEPTPALPTAVALGQGQLGRVALERRAQLLQGADTDGGALLAAPILAGPQLLGLLALLARGSRPVGRTELLLLQALANHIGDVLGAGGEVGAQLDQALRRFRTSWSAATRGG